MLNRWLYRAARHIPLPVYRLLIRRKAIALYYHVVSDEQLPHVRHLYPYKSVAMFERDLAYLRRDYHPISYEQYLDHTRSGKRLPSNALLLTFDDGFSQCFSVVRPLLKKLGVPCTFFIATATLDNHDMLYRHVISLCIDRVKTAKDHWRQAAFALLNKNLGLALDHKGAFIQWLRLLDYTQRGLTDAICKILEVDVTAYLRDRQPYLTAEQVRIMASEGFTIGAHTKTHPLLKLLSEEEMKEEIIESCRVIRKIARRNQVPFAFPFSGHGVNRAFLEGIRSGDSGIGLIFDTMGIREEKDFIFNRIEADHPSDVSSGQTNLPRLIHNAYQEVFLQKTTGFQPV